METFLALMHAAGVAVALAANTTAFARFIASLRRRASVPRGATDDATVVADGPLTGPSPEPAANTPVAPPVTPEPDPARAAPARAAPRTTVPSTAIRTPDQRLRVFVSSTLRELAPERVAARRAIESLRLSPVMFESGARPHPPRDLYRAYLAQSDVFVAIYAQRYGWIAPGEEVSGLEDEYRLSAGMPKLVYVRESETPRDEALERLLDRVRDDDHASYRSFRSPDELADLLENDLALLLSERFVATGAAPGAEAPPVAAHGPPAAVTSFVGRESLLRSAESMLRRPDVRLVTLYGPGGAGKSRLAIELAGRLGADFAHDVIYVSLAAVRDPALVASTLAIGLGVKERVGTGTVRAMQEALAERAGLLVIDNFEHLLDAAPVVSQLLQAAPRLTVLVTSRSVLRLSGETVFRVPPLDLPPRDAPLGVEQLLEHDAIALFVDRARAVAPTFELDDDNAAAVVEICRRVDALPLAIELAAARVRSLAPQALLSRMTRRLPMLRGGPRDAPARHRTLRDTIAWSVDLLTTEERTLLARLATFDGGGSLGAIERVLGDDASFLDDLSSLVDRSLVQRVDDSEDDRIVLLETVREYAAELLEGDAAAAEVRERHARAYLALAEEGAKGLRGPKQSLWGTWLRRDLGNLRAAMTTFLALGAHAEALRLATALRPLFMMRCHYEEGTRLLRLALDADDAPHGGERAAALLALGALAWRQGDLVAALPPAEEALTTYRALGDDAGSAAALRLLGVHAHNVGDYDLAHDRLSEALDLMRRDGDDESVASTLLTLGNVAFDRAEEGALALYEESRAIAGRLGDTLVIAYALDNMSALAWCHGDLDAAEARTTEAAVLYDELDHQFGRANVLHRRGLIAFVRGDLATAESLLRESLRLRSDIGEVRGSAFIQHDLARVALAAGDADAAGERFRAGLDLAERHGAPLITTLYLEGVAELLAHLGRHEEALEALATAAAWRRAARVPVCRVRRAQGEALLASLRTEIGGRSVEIEARGAARTPAEAALWVRRHASRSISDAW